MIRRVAFAPLAVGMLAQAALGQAPSKAVRPTPQAPAIVVDRSDLPPPPPVPVALDRRDDPPQPPTPRTNPLPRRASVTADANANATATTRRDAAASTGRFANPGGVGRYAEYYTANTLAPQVDFHAKAPPRFDRGAGPDRAAQVAAFQVGQQRTANIQNNINAYGRPYGAYGAGFGFGFGLATGGLYGGGFR